MPSVENFDDVLKLREQGYSFHYDKRNDIFKIYDPRTKKYVGTISRRLTEAVKALLGMRTRKEEKAPPSPGPRREEIEKGLEDDVQFMITTMKQRLDPKLPVMTKFVEDVSWWQHLMFDFSKMAVPEVFALMKADDIDVKNPETTAERMVNKVKELKEVARKVSELESRLKTVEGEYQARISALESENAMLKDLVKKYEDLYDKAVETALSKIEDLKRRIEETIVLITREVPSVLSEEERTKYLALVYPKIEKIWSGPR
jgi:sugar-specific transcriptional regulator TrmB